MAARVSMSTKNAQFDAVRQRIGFRLALVPLVTISLVNLFTLVAELAGMSLALEMATGYSYRLWSIPAVLLLWFILWKGPFSLIENGASILGMFILVFVWAAWKLHPPLHEIAGAMWRPETHGHPAALYAFTAVALIGSFVSPFQVLFYSSGAIEEEWGKDYLWANRIIASMGNIFGGVAAACILIVAAMLLFPLGMKVDQITQASLGPVMTLGAKGLWLFIAGLFFCSMAAGLQVALSSTYAVTEYFGWHWKKDEPPVRSAMFHLVHMRFLVVSVLIVLSGLDPSKVTQGAMVFNAVALPFTLFPLLLVARDPVFTQPPLTNGRISNALGWFFFVVLCVVSLAGSPLFIMTGGGG
jgi:Mn2+/Fe2+ NRAMP family transporter